MKRKILVIALMLTITSSLVACGGKTDETTNIKDGTIIGAEAGIEAISSEKETAETEDEVINDVTAVDDIILDGSKLGTIQKMRIDKRSSLEGLIITTGSGQHEYPDVNEIIEKTGYGTTNLYSEYCLNEWISLFAKTSEPDLEINIYVVKNDDSLDYTQMNVIDIENIAIDAETPVLWSKVADVENNGYLADFYLNPELCEAGLYNIFFVTKDMIDVVQLNIIPE